MATQGPFLATTSKNDPATGGATGNIPWSNLGAIFNNNLGDLAEVTVNRSQQASQGLWGQGFGFTLGSTDVVDGIFVQSFKSTALNDLGITDWGRDGGAESAVLGVRLIKNDVAVGLGRGNTNTWFS